MAYEAHVYDLTTASPSVDPGRSADASQICRQIFELLKTTTGATGGTIHILEGRQLVPLATFPDSSDHDLKVRVPIGGGIVGRVLATHSPHYVPDLKGNGASADGIASFLVIPLVRDGRPIGVLQVDSSAPDAFPARVHADVMALAPLITSALDGALELARSAAENDGLHADARARKDVLSVVAHELRTPLAAVLGFAETLNQRAGSMNPEMIATAGRHMVKASRRLDRLIGDLLDVSRLDRGNLPVRPTEVHLQAIIDQALFEVEIAEHDLEVDVPPTLPAVRVDADRLHQVLVNLLNNARKYSHPGSVIRVRAAATANRVTISVTDQGVGIPADQLMRVFEPFHQVDDIRRPNVTGLGLGLYLVREICSAMDCDVRVDSELGRGSTFSIDIPLAART